jgi:hypothetical protein
MVSTFDRFVEITNVIVSVDASESISFLLSQEVDPTATNCAGD